tara:strand:+ start:164 stop:343 length:180 start_codon:yes stop_codon:yes gene_type:complete
MSILIKNYLSNLSNILSDDVFLLVPLLAKDILKAKKQKKKSIFVEMEEVQQTQCISLMT